MIDEQKTKQELIQELDILRQGVADLKQSELARKRAEEALRESEEKYRAVFENTGAATVVIEENSIISLANAEFVRLSGYSLGEIEGKKSWTEFVVKEDLERMQAQHRLRRQNGEKALRHYEFRFVRRNGNIRNIYLSIDVILGTTKSVASLLDITERKRAEEALYTEKQRFQTLSEQAPFGMVMINQDSTFKYINPKFRELFGYELTDVPDGKTWFRKAYPDPTYRHHVIETWIKDLEVFKPGEKRFKVFTVTCKDGTEKIINFLPVQLATGEKLMACENITERKWAEEALMQAEERFRSLFNEAPVGYHEVDKEGYVTKLNYTELNMLGYTAQEVIGQPIWKFTAEPEKVKRIFEAKIAADLMPGQAFERIYRRKDGTTLIVIAEDRLLKNEKGGIIGIRTTIQDITDRKRAQEEREKLIQELQDALASIKRLRGLLPICASCKKIRDDKGYWNQIESYIRDHSEAEFSHGICPECFKKLYPDQFVEDL
jgi:PAS domain S-box-containing protein